ncbi:hypothetical protein [Vibrio sp. 11986-1-5]|uniref:hypothetical protein n=1 Tax=Vibrio sp. 11986-1-5 TaxID=2211215 RepID=UPI000D72E826|nr:hypothetical protein [Vibrio sp. 11986-1-5]PXA69696.1 hypothetical protein DMC15_14915 [Vibrio sp. 11986-1-5]
MTKTKDIINVRLVNTLSAIVFLFLLICLTRQVPITFLSDFIAPLLLLTCLLTLIKGVYRESIRPFLVFFIFLLIASIYSIYKGNETSLNLRFFVIILLLNLIPILKFDGKFLIKAFNLVFFIQALTVIGVGVTLPIMFDIDNYLPVRHWVLNNGWGDIYTYNGLLYKVQIVGNALLPFAFFVNFYLHKKGDSRLIYLIVYFTAIVFCGNLAFYLFFAIFVFFHYLIESQLRFKLSVRNFIFSMLLGVVLTIFIGYAVDTIVMKSTGDVSSIGTRFDQASVLLGDMSGSLNLLLFGNGLGHTLSIKTMSRDYTGDIYFELQFLYILNQIGFIGMIVFIYAHLKIISPLLSNIKILLIYLCYIGYAMINPYMFDSNHGIALIILMSLASINSFGKTSNEN